MVFGLFTRKQLPPAHPPQDPAPTQSKPPPLSPAAQLRTPSPSVDSASVHKPNSPPREPPVTPSPPPAEPTPADLHALIESIPPQTLHSYTLANLTPPNVPDSQSLHHISSFFHALVPPPRLHCVRCHKSFFDVENTDRSCLVPHDDDSAEVERVAAKSTKGTLYETLWGCCGRTVEGDGDMGPPDGWCYEGKHTTDTKRARFRADSTLQDDKLTSCERLRCHAPPRSSRAVRKRGRPVADDSEVDDEGNESSTSASAPSLSASPRSSNGKRRTKKPRTQTKDESAESEIAADERMQMPTDPDHMDVDDAPPPTASPPKSKRKPRAKPKSTPLSPFNAKSLATTPKTSSPLVLSPPFVSNSASPEPPSKARVVIRSKSKPSLKPKSSAASLKPKSSVTIEMPPKPESHSQRTSQTQAEASSSSQKPKSKGRTNVKGRVKELVEVIDSSIDGERAAG